MNRLIIMTAVAVPLVVAQPTIVQGPIVEAITYSSARITWLTDNPADTMIRYGRTQLDAETVDTTAKTRHSWFVSGLAPGTTYRYQVCSTDKGSARTCSDERSFTTEVANDEIPRLPLPPKQYVDTAMPSGTYGNPFLIDESCSNLQNVLSGVASIEGDSNYEIIIPPRTTCAGLWMFPRRPNHTGWIVVKSAGTLPPEGIRVGPEDSREMPRLVTNALPGNRFSLVSFQASCVPGTFTWANGVTGMGLYVCFPQGNSGGAKSIAEYARGDTVVLTVPGHGYATGNIVKVTGTTAVDGTWRITVVNENQFSLDGVRPTRTYSGSGMVARNDAWGLAPHRTGPELPGDCIPNNWFLRTDGAPADSLYWCTSENNWTHVRPGNYPAATQVAAIQFAEGASRYRFVGIEVTHIPVPNPPPAERANAITNKEGLDR